MDIPNLEQHIDVSVAQLCALEASKAIDLDDPDQLTEDLTETSDKAEAHDWEEPDIEDE